MKILYAKRFSKDIVAIQNNPAIQENLFEIREKGDHHAASQHP